MAALGAPRYRLGAGYYSVYRCGGVTGDCVPTYYNESLGTFTPTGFFWLISGDKLGLKDESPETE